MTESLASRCRSVGDQCSILARACDDYADHVEEQRAAVLDVVHDLLRDAVIIEGIGIVLGAFTVGGTAEAALAINAARIAAAAPRLLRIVETLRMLASTCAAPMRLAAEALRDVRAELAVFRRVRITVASAYKAERVARVERLRGAPQQSPSAGSERSARFVPRLTFARCASRLDLKPVSDGDGVKYVDPVHEGRQIRVMDGYPPGSRPDPMTEGPYAVISQNGSQPVKVPLFRNPGSVSAQIVAGLLDDMEESFGANGYLPALRAGLVAPQRRPHDGTMNALARRAYDEFTSRHATKVVWTRWPIDLDKAWPLGPDDELDFDLDPDQSAETPLQVLVPVDQAPIA